MKILIATGRKAEGLVKDAIKSANLENRIKCDVLTQGIDIAAFSTSQSLKKALEKHFHFIISKEKSFTKKDKKSDSDSFSKDFFLKECLSDYDLILVSGLCTADFSSLEKEIVTKIRLGPRHAFDLRDVLPFTEKMEFSPHIPADQFLAMRRKENAMKQLYVLENGVQEKFRIKGVKIGNGARMKVCAELVDATRMGEEEISRKMMHFLECGADIIDIGVHIGAKEREVKKAVETALSVANNIPLSVDTLDAKLIFAGIESGADMVLSLNKDNLSEVGKKVAGNDIAAVVIPNFNSGSESKSYESLLTNIKIAAEMGVKKIIADPVLNSIGYGIANSLYNYYLFRLHDKNTPLFFGVGNVTELMDADSVGINATLAGIASELDVDILFTPEYSDKAKGSVKELKVASEMMMLSKARKSAPKDVGLNLLRLKEKRRKPISSIRKDEIIVAKENEKWRMDPKGCVRVGICEIEGEKKIFAEHLPSSKIIVGKSAKEVMDTILRLNMVSLLEHASYLSKELEKAELALKIDRSYVQDEDLFNLL